jgi:hypothetical protein
MIFNALMESLDFDAQKIRDDAKRMLTFIKESTMTEEEFIQQSATTEGDMGLIFDSVRSNRFFKYCDAWGIGLGRLLELRNIEPTFEVFERWATSLKFVSGARIMQSWSEFCGDQLRMQGIEAMQKQILIREKKRAAERLEEKAASFESKKKALSELNRMIQAKRERVIAEKMELKQLYDPDQYRFLNKNKVVKDDNSIVVEPVMDEVKAT